MNIQKILLTGIVTMSVGTSVAQQSADTDSVSDVKTHNLQEVTVVRRRSGVRRATDATNGILITRDELFKAACCNLGESFVTNPSVDVSYNDAATGAKQIKLLGLSGTYVQMLTETLPNYRGAAIPYALGYVPGAWMKGIQVSKGSASVKNGYESITGQINIDFLKPEDPEGLSVNLYGNSEARMEANVDGSIHLKEGLSTEILSHYSDTYRSHDGNDDGFIDMPKVRQLNLQNRWQWKTGNYIFHGGLALIDEKRTAGQTDHTHHLSTGLSPFEIKVNTNRYEGFMKHAFVLDPSHGTNIALLGSLSMHRQNALYGNKVFDVNEKNAYASLLFETQFSPLHSLSTGVSFNHDYFGQTLTAGTDAARIDESQLRPGGENVAGAYAQYTLNIGKLTAMAGLRIDNSNIHGTFVTPRLHLKYTPATFASFRLSAGKGYRSVFALAENHNLLAGGRMLVIDKLDMEEAWNYGLSGAFYIPLFGKTLKLNAEYYYTDFEQQAVIDYDSSPGMIRIANLQGKSYSHTWQVDATYEPVQGLEVTAAYRYNDVKTTYGDGRLQRKPFTSKYKTLLSASYKTPLGLWQFDATLQLNGGGRMPTPRLTADNTPAWASTFSAYEQLSAQVTRNFRRFSVYVGGENLTGFKQKNPIIGYHTPWEKTFDPTMVYGPVTGAMVYAGIRFNIGKNRMTAL